MVVVTQSELAAVMRATGIAATPTSPLAGVRAAQADKQTAASLASKGVTVNGGVTDDWRRVIATLADPSSQASVHVEGVGAGRYFGGAGGIVGLVNIDDGYGVLGSLSIDGIINEANFLLPWREIPDAPAMRLDLSLGELSVVAAVTDAHREEELLASIERRQLRGGAVTHDVAERMIDLGTTRSDLRWLVSILKQFSSPGREPRLEHLPTGATSLIARKLASADGAVLKIGPELLAYCVGLVGLGPFMVFSVHAPWDEPTVKIFLRGVRYFWCIESGAGRASISRLGGRAMETLLRQSFSAFEQHSARQPQDDMNTAVAGIDDSDPPLADPPAAEPPRWRATPPAAPASQSPTAKAAPASTSQQLAAKCPKCGKAAKAGKRFCTSCGTSLVVS